MSKRLSNYLTLDEISQLLGVETFDKFDDHFIAYNYCRCSEEMQKQEKCECGYEQARSDLFNNYVSACLVIAEKLLKEHGLKLLATRKSWRWKLLPIVSWKDAATRIMETIEGYGMFGYNHNLQEFLRSGPYTPYQAVINHIHWLKKYYEVYGEVNAEGQLERKMRY